MSKGAHSTEQVHVVVWVWGVWKYYIEKHGKNLRKKGNNSPFVRVVFKVKWSGHSKYYDT